MNLACTRVLCRLLIVLMAWTPFQLAQAGMIGTGQVASQASQADRNTVSAFIDRAEAAGQLQALGLDPATAKDRVAALSDAEAQYLADRIQSLPAGASSDWGWGVLILLIVLGIAWYVWKR